MHADIKGSLEYMKTRPIPFEHREIKLTQEQAKKVLEYGLRNGYKTNKKCEHFCPGLCRESC